jgi:hypothetical protein
VTSLVFGSQPVPLLVVVLSPPAPPAPVADAVLVAVLSVELEVAPAAPPAPVVLLAVLLAVLPPVLLPADVVSWSPEQPNAAATNDAVVPSPKYRRNVIHQFYCETRRTEDDRSLRAARASRPTTRA